MKRVLKVGGIILGVLGVLVGGGVVALASGFDDKMSAPDTPYPAITASSDPQIIARGEYLVRSVAHCGHCHSSYERGTPASNTADGPLSGGFEFDMGILQLWAANLTPDTETGIGRRTDAELARTIRHGVLPDGQISIFMRYSASKLSDDDLTAVISYLRAQPAVKREVKPAEIGILGKAMIGMVQLTPNLDVPPQHVPPPAEPTLERGEYLAEYVSACVPCHSHADMSTFMPTGPKAGGGDPAPAADGNGEFVPPNLTSHPTGITGKLDEDGFVARLRAGRTHTYSIMPWEDVARASDTDLRSIYRYLKSLPPVDNEVGPTFRP